MHSINFFLSFKNFYILEKMFEIISMSISSSQTFFHKISFMISLNMQIFSLSVDMHKLSMKVFLCCRFIQSYLTTLECSECFINMFETCYFEIFLPWNFLQMLQFKISQEEQLEPNGKMSPDQHPLLLSTIVFHLQRQFPRDSGWWTVVILLMQLKWRPNFTGKSLF